MLLANYQSHVLGPSEPVNYPQIVRTAYPTNAIQTEPFVGFKILCKDMNAFTLGNTGDRLRQLDTFCPTLKGTGCVLRESGQSVMTDGLWLISMPVPRSQVNIQLDLMIKVLRVMELNFGIIPVGIFEVCVSGKCMPNEIEMKLNRVSIPSNYQHMLIVPADSPYKMGNCKRINDYYMMFKTMWNMSNDLSAQNMYVGLRDNLDALSLRLSVIF